MNNRVTGDFDADTIEAFRVAYAASMEKPEDHDIDPISQIPTNVISNTSPWIEHTGLWKANDGMSRDFKPNQPFNPDDYFGPDGGVPEGESEGELEDELPDFINDESDDGDEEVMTEDEFQLLADEIWDDEENQEYNPESEPYYSYEDDGGEPDEDDDELDEGEVEELIREILGSEDEDDDEDDDDYYGTDD